MSTQKALYLVEAKGALAVRQREIPTPGEGEVLVEIHATALNPIDWKIQAFDVIITEYPTILGLDAAGIVKAIGANVTNLAVGDRVLHQGNLTHQSATFQQYAIVPAEIVAKIPDNVSFDQASTIPSTLATAGVGLYLQKPFGLGLELAWEESGRGKYAGQPFLVIGGASSVGQHVIQVAKLSGFSPIITTASSSNEAYLKSLGATQVIDRSVPLSSLTSAITKITSKPILYAYDSISFKDTQEAAYAALAPGGTLVLTLPAEIEKPSADKTFFQVYGSWWHENNRTVGASLHRKLAALIAAGDIKPNRVEVLPNGLNGIQGGLDKLRRGEVHAAKLVARPQETA